MWTGSLLPSWLQRYAAVACGLQPAVRSDDSFNCQLLVTDSVLRVHHSGSPEPAYLWPADAVLPCCSLSQVPALFPTHEESVQD